jgi:hypothetical protein
MDEYGQRDLFSGVANNRGSESEQRASARARRTRRVII